MFIHSFNYKIKKKIVWCEKKSRFFGKYQSVSLHTLTTLGVSLVSFWNLNTMCATMMSP